MIIILFSIIYVGYTSLTITGYVNKERIPQYNLNYSVSNFGHIPYGKTLTGTIYIPPFNNSDKMELCKLDSENIDNVNKFFLDYQSKWLIVKRGGCPFTIKAINAQTLGASFVIIVDDKNENVQSIIMADDGHGYQVRIPSVLISNEDGEKIIQQVLESSNIIHGVIKFNETSTFEIPQILMGLSINNRESFKLIREFKQYKNKLGDSINMSIYYEIFTLPSSRKSGYTQNNNNCVGGGRYCQIDPDGEDFGTGQDVVREQLRQLCLWETDQNQWWTYMDKFDIECAKPKEYQDCSSKLLSFQLQQKVEKCVSDSYDTSSQSDQLLAPNKILEKQLEYRLKTGITFYPGVSINYKAYRGNIEASQIFEAICASMQEEHPSCSINYFGETELNAEQNSYFWLIMFIVITSILFTLFMIFIYRRMVQKQLNQEMKVRLDDMVSNYMKFYEGRDK